MNQRNSRTKKYFYRFFIAQNLLEPKLQLLSQIIQNLVYLIIINGIRFQEILNVFAQNSIVFTALLIICLLKITFKVVLRFGITLVALQIILTKPDLWLIPNCFLLTIISIFQFLSSIVFNYSSQSLQVESRIENKVMRLSLLIGNIIILNLVQTPIYIHLVSAVLFIGLLWSKERSLMKSQQCRTIDLRFYLFAACEHLRLFLTHFLPFSNTLSAAVTAFLLSQSLYALLVHYRPTLTCYQLLAKEEYLRLSFIVLQNVHSTDYNADIEKIISNILNDYAEVQTVSFEGSDFRQLQTQTSKNALFCYMLGLLKKSDGFLEALLCAEIHAQAGRLLLALQTLEKANMKLDQYDLLKRIMLLHAQQRIATMFANSSSKVTYLYEQALRSFYNFQEMIYKAALQHLKFNLYLKRTQIELIKIKKICQKIITQDKQIVEEFQRVRMGFSASTQLFLGFSILVREDFAGTLSVLNEQQLMERQLLSGHLKKKMFISLILSADGPTISRVGFNARQLLGYNRSELQGQPVERLVPPFFRTQHQKISNAFIHRPIKHLLLLQRQAIVLDNQGGYKLCNIVLRMRLGTDGLFFYEGYVRVLESKQHDLNSFFSANPQGVLLQWSEGLFEEQDETERPITKVEHLLKGTLGETMVRTTKGQLYESYDPILTHKGENPFYFYSKRLVQQKQCSKKAVSLKEITTPILQEKIEGFNSSSEELDKMKKYIQNNQINFLFILTIILILGLFGSQYLIIISANVKYNNQNFAINSFIPLIQFYQTVMHMEINLIYSDLNNTYNYYNNFTNPVIDQIVLKLQNANQKLKTFNLGKYILPTYNNAISYQQSNYQFVQMIIADAQLYQKFINDSFTKTTAFDQFKMVINTFATKGAITDYRASMLSLMASFVQNDIYYENIALGVNLANILIFLLFAFRIFWKLRQVEEAALEARCLNSPQVGKIKDILHYIREITLQEVPIDKLNEETQVQEMVSVVQNSNNISNLISEASLIRNNTLRCISEEKGNPLESINQTGFLQDMQKKKKPYDKYPEKSSYIFRKTNSYNQVIIVFYFFVSLLTTLTLINEILNYTNKNVDEVASLNNILTIQKSTTYYSHRGVVMTFIAMLQKNENSYDTSAAYLPFVQSFLTFVSTISMPVFPELQFDEFKNVSVNLNHLYQDPICSFMACDPQLYDQINLNYLSVMKKYGVNLPTMYKATFNYTRPQMEEYISNNKHYIDIILYTEKLIREYITNLVMNYLDSYNLFIVNLYSSKLNYSTAMIGITAVGLFLFLLFVRQTFKEQQKLIQTILIYQKDIHV